MADQDGVPEEWREGMRTLTRAFREVDENRAFDRCSIDVSCQNPSIKAHALPRTALELIADKEGMVIGSHPDPPQNPIAWEAQNALDTRNIRRFSIGQWACDEHDKLFSPIDSKSIDFSDERNLFLAIYRLTLRSTQYVLRVGDRLVSTTIESESPLIGLPDSAVENIKQVTRQTFDVAKDLFVLSVRMNRFLEEESFDRIEYRIAEFYSVPTLAASGMKRLDGPGTGVYWDDKNWVANNSSIPAWLVVLPQDHGQTVITASLPGYDRYTADFHSGVPKFGEIRKRSGANWGRLMSRKILECSFDLALSIECYQGLTASEQIALQDYLRRRSLNVGRRPKLPNLLR